MSELPSPSSVTARSQHPIGRRQGTLGAIGTGPSSSPSYPWSSDRPTQSPYWDTAARVQQYVQPIDGYHRQASVSHLQGIPDPWPPQGQPNDSTGSLGTPTQLLSSHPAARVQQGRQGTLGAIGTGPSSSPSYPWSSDRPTQSPYRDTAARVQQYVQPIDGYHRQASVSHLQGIPDPWPPQGQPNDSTGSLGTPTQLLSSHPAARVQQGRQGTLGAIGTGPSSSPSYPWSSDRPTQSPYRDTADHIQQYVQPIDGYHRQASASNPQGTPGAIGSRRSVTRTTDLSKEMAPLSLAPETLKQSILHLPIWPSILWPGENRSSLLSTLTTMKLDACLEELLKRPSDVSQTSLLYYVIFLAYLCTLKPESQHTVWATILRYLNITPESSLSQGAITFLQDDRSDLISPAMKYECLHCVVQCLVKALHWKELHTLGRQKWMTVLFHFFDEFNLHTDPDNIPLKLLCDLLFVIHCCSTDPVLSDYLSVTQESRDQLQQKITSHLHRINIKNLSETNRAYLPWLMVHVVLCMSKTFEDLHPNSFKKGERGMRMIDYDPKFDELFLKLQEEQQSNTPFYQACQRIIDLCCCWMPIWACQPRFTYTTAWHAPEEDIIFQRQTWPTIVPQRDYSYLHRAIYHLGHLYLWRYIDTRLVTTCTTVSKMQLLIYSFLMQYSPLNETSALQDPRISASQHPSILPVT